MEKAVNKNPDEEYVGIMKDEKKGIAHVMALRRTRGVISDRKKFEFDLVADNSLSSFLLQYYSSVPMVPRFVYVNEDPDDMQMLEASLEKIAGHKVSIFNVERVLSKDKRQLMDLIVRNLSMYIERGYDPAVVELKNALKLGSIPEVIDCLTFQIWARRSRSAPACDLQTTSLTNRRTGNSGSRRFWVRMTLQ
jgi:excinuclease ABC subunit C